LFATAAIAEEAVVEKPDLSGNDPHWVQDSRTKCWAGTPNPVPGETIQWAGDCTNGLISGLGVLTWYKNGEIIGRDSTNFKDGIPWGHGRIHGLDGSLYEGDFPGKGTVTLRGGGNAPAQAVRVTGGWKIEQLPAGQ
jgi:hypothetical protein